MSEEPLPLGEVVCPKCGWRTSFAYNLCLKCGVPMISVVRENELRDRGLAFGIGGFSAVLCGYFIFVATQASGGFAYERELPVLIAGVVTGWLWFLPILAVIVGDPRRKKQGIPVSPWRLFWQMQAIMYAASMAISLLCLATCATR